MQGNDATMPKETAPGPGSELRLYTMNEIAALFQVHRNTVENWVRSGRLPVHRFGWRTVRITQADLDAFLEGGGPGRVYQTGPRRRAGTRSGGSSASQDAE